MSTTTNISTLKINCLTQAQYDAAVEGGTINENELYLTPADDTASFGRVKVGSTFVDADTPKDTLEIIAGDGITLTPNASNDTITISGGATTIICDYDNSVAEITALNLVTPTGETAITEEQMYELFRSSDDMPIGIDFIVRSTTGLRAKAVWDFDINNIDFDSGHCMIVLRWYSEGYWSSADLPLPQDA